MKILIYPPGCKLSALHRAVTAFLPRASKLPEIGNWQSCTSVHSYWELVPLALGGAAGWLLPALVFISIQQLVRKE